MLLIKGREDYRYFKSAVQFCFPFRLVLQGLEAFFYNEPHPEQEIGVAMKSARALLVVLLLMAAASEFFAADTLPERLTDAEFWKMIQDFSEPDGPFPYENFVSNESNYQTVIPALKQTVK